MAAPARTRTAGRRHRGWWIWTLWTAVAVSDDGRTIVGDDSNRREAWLAFLPDPYVVVADDFEAGPFALQTLFAGPGGAVTATQSGLSGQDVLGGARTVRVEARGTASPATADLAVGGSPDALLFATPPGGGILDLGYAPAAPIDLTNGGEEDRFVVDLAEASAAATLSITVQDDAGAVSVAAFVPVSGPGRLEIPYTGVFGAADLSRIASVALNFDTVAGGQWRFSILRTGRPPFCRDGIDNDGDALIDWDGGGVGDPDPQCLTSWKNSETPAGPCGLGAELLLVMPLWWVARRSVERRGRSRRELSRVPCGGSPMLARLRIRADVAGIEATKMTAPRPEPGRVEAALASTAACACAAQARRGRKRGGGRWRARGLPVRG